MVFSKYRIISNGAEFRAQEEDFLFSFWLDLYVTTHFGYTTPKTYQSFQDASIAVESFKRSEVLSTWKVYAIEDNKVFEKSRWRV